MAKLTQMGDGSAFAMKQLNRLDRPALTAIAAVLAFSSTTAFAQEVAPDAAPPVETIAPAQQAPEPNLPPVAPSTIPDASSTQAPVNTQAPVAAPPLPQIAPTVTAAPPLPEVETPAPVVREAAAPQRTERAAPPVAERAATPQRPATSERAAPPPVAPASVAERSTSPSANPAPIEQAPVVETAAPAQVAENDATPWIAGIGGAVLLLGVGAFAWRQRRTASNRDLIVDAPMTEPVVPVAAPSHAYAFTPAVVPSMLAEDRAPAPRATMPLAASPLSAERWPELEAMVAAAPSAENPFLTRGKRLRRAHYLLDHGQPQVLAMPDQSAVAPAANAAVMGNRQYKPQPVYDFGKATPIRRPSWKPATT